MAHRKKLLEIIEDLGKTPSIVSLRALNFLHYVTQYNQTQEKEKTMSDKSAPRVYAVFTTAMQPQYANDLQNRPGWLAKHLYHRPARELGMA
jgi:hypothetical protein